MKKPKSFSTCDDDAAIEAFVIAAATDLAAACDLLFISAHDLTWGAKEHGLFLVGLYADEQGFDETIQVIEARSKLNLNILFEPLMRRIQPLIIKGIKKIAP